jgi:putative tryptophan/tyrosine transport system substrate-binding protein
MRRREFITALGGVAAGWPLAARAQQMPVVGLLVAQANLEVQTDLAAFRQGLTDGGFFEGRNLSIVYRSAEGDVSRLPALAAELIGIPVKIIAAVGGDAATHAAMAATSTVPIVFTSASDPVEAGIVTSLNRPSGNVTGATQLGGLLSAKEIGLLREMIPKLATIGLLVSPLVPMRTVVTRDVQEAAQAAGLRAVVLDINSERDLDTAFVTFVEQKTDALVIPAGQYFVTLRDRVVALAARNAIPTIYNGRNAPAMGGLMSYGADIRDTYRQAGLYAARILQGEKPGDLPVMQPTKFELVINLKTAKVLGLTVPPGLLAIADEVIE